MRECFDPTCMCHVEGNAKPVSRSVHRRILAQKELIEDGFGSTWSARCPECGKLSMCVVRPGKVQCNNCA